MHRKLHFQFGCIFQAGGSFGVQRQQQADAIGNGEQPKRLPLRFGVVALVEVAPQFGFPEPFLVLVQLPQRLLAQYVTLAVLDYKAGPMDPGREFLVDPLLKLEHGSTGVLRCLFRGRHEQHRQYQQAGDQQDARDVPTGITYQQLDRPVSQVLTPVHAVVFMRGSQPGLPVGRVKYDAREGRSPQ